jgi:hypothetical protein
MMIQTERPTKFVSIRVLPVLFISIVRKRGISGIGKLKMIYQKVELRVCTSYAGLVDSLNFRLVGFNIKYVKILLTTMQIACTDIISLKTPT